MTPAIALQINEVLVGAWMIREGLKEAPLPDVTSFSPQDAVRASEMMRDERLGRTQHANGSVTMTCFVEPTRVPSLYAWALARWADGE